MANIALYVSANSAQAGAWLQKKDNLELITTFRYLSSDKFFDNSGNKFSNTKFSKSEFNAYGEYGLSDGWTIGGAATLINASRAGTGGEITALSDYSLSSAEIFARHKLFSSGDYVISIEPRLNLPLDNNLNINPEGNKPIPELKLSYGQAYDIHENGIDYDSFFDLSATYRHRANEKIADMLKFSLTSGSRPFGENQYLRPIFFLFESSFEKSLTTYKAAESSGNYDLLKVEASLGYNLDEDTRIQAGYFHNIYGVNTVAGNGIMLSAWLNF